MCLTDASAGGRLGDPGSGVQNLAGEAGEALKEDIGANRFRHPHRDAVERRGAFGVKRNSFAESSERWRAFAVKRNPQRLLDGGKNTRSVGSQHAYLHISAGLSRLLSCVIVKQTTAIVAAERCRGFGERSSEPRSEVVLPFCVLSCL